jgi:signal peptidase II
LRLSALVVVLVLLVDQCVKFWVKLSFTYTESVKVFDWFYLYFIENEGMAFGMTLGGESGKLILSIFRIIAVFAIAWYLRLIIKQKANRGLIICLSLILAGALGNIVDSVLYGKIFSASTTAQVAQLFPESGGYAGWLHGRVVDMFYFPLYEGYLPDWIPLWGGDYFIFFRPIFNVADSAISIGVIAILLLQKKFFPDNKKENKSELNTAENKMG